ncbi:hypothetical protein Pla52o_36870 [Novipirellula galeiformis]|uniref:DUF1598 domain-containing protein n=1 Tax=Novipirellula galeiformis TaxID=2528004 RepID=A0A5C6CA87_9BACT|nr:DUF1598 domain-containing protein [Novipirellula galeiformis]TWU21500.1 hypothetical protein Pla52o_36870 [Novipirellula galeiformis]
MEFGPLRILRFVASVIAVIGVSASLQAGLNNIQGRQSVGGVMIDAEGMVRNATLAEQHELANAARAALKQAEGEMAEATELRMISLAKLQRQLQASREAGEPISSEVEFLAGLQRIEYVFVDPDKQDIIIAGPAEPWKMLDDGSVVGTVSGKSTMRLADLIVALRTVEDARNGGISCSIEPTADGRQRLQNLLRNVKLRPGQNPAIYEASMKQAFGPQMIHLNGVPQDSRYARVLVAADFEMKRVAMELAPSHVAGLPSYLQMAKNSRHNASQNPRWWMACNYDTMLKSEDALAWKLSGQGVKTLTDQDLVGADGDVKAAGRSDKIAQTWAETMTQKYPELAQKIHVFGDLQNIMDMTVVATLITQERLDQKAGIDLSLLKQESEAVELTSYAVPKALHPQCSFVRGRSGWTVTASGGVDIDAFSVVEKQTVNAAVATEREASLAAASDRWWWNR